MPTEKVKQIKVPSEKQVTLLEKLMAHELEDVQKKMGKLQTQERAKGASVLSSKQKQAIIKFRKRVLEIRRELRQVQLNLRRDIDNLDSRLRLINIAAMPAAIALFAIVIALVRRNRKRARTAV